MRRLGYFEIGRSGKHFNTKDKIMIDQLFMFSGFRANFVKLEKGYFLRVEPVKKIVRKDTALDVIDKIYQDNQNQEKE